MLGPVLMLASLQTRLHRLEAQRQASNGPHEQGIAALLDEARHLGITGDHVPIAALTAAELDAQIAVLAGQRGLAIVLRAYLEAERARRQAHTEESPA